LAGALSILAKVLLFEAHFNEIDAVILDVVMPIMGGGEVAGKIHML